MTKDEQEAADAQIAEAEKAAQEELAGFSAEFGDAPVVTDESVKPAPVEKKVVEPEPVVEEEPKEVVYAQITPEQLDDILAKANTVPEVRAEMKKLQDTSAGRIGNLEQTIKNLQANTPVGKPITVTAEMLGRVTKEYGDLGARLAEDLTELFAQFKGTGEAAKIETPEEFNARIAPLVQAGATAEVEKERQKFAHQILEDRHEDYATLMGIDGAAVVEGPWKKWLKTQPAEYQTKMLASWNGFELAKSIDKFKAHEAEVAKAAAEKLKKPAPKTPDVRAQRLLEAVPVRGGSVVRTKAEVKTEEEAFLEEINS